MRPLPREFSICSFCSIRTQIPRLPFFRNSRHLRPASSTPVRTFIASPPRAGLFSGAAAPTSKTSEQSTISPYASTVDNFTALESSIQSRLLDDPKKAASEAEVLAALTACQRHAKLTIASGRVKTTSNPTSAILSLNSDDLSPSSIPTTPAAAAVSPTARRLNAIHANPSPGDFTHLSNLSVKILLHPHVFLTPPILTSFVAIQGTTRDPAPIPAAFSLYATKPALTRSGRERAANPNSAKNAIPERAALAALECAIDAGDMAAALDVVDTSYAAPAWRQSKIVRRALPFVATAAAAPVALWTIADNMAWWQDTVDHGVATKYAFAGLGVYAAFTGSIGMVAMLTANDQMERVTWMKGTPLTERWMREEERAALDAVAMAWGFGDSYKRGLEEGEEWELLREVCERKGMVLDDPTLMEGME